MRLALPPIRRHRQPWKIAAITFYHVTAAAPPFMLCSTSPRTLLDIDGRNLQQPADMAMVAARFTLFHAFVIASDVQ
jgi:hypothetical protein